MTLVQRYIAEWKELSAVINPDSDSVIELKDGYIVITGTVRGQKGSVRLLLPKSIEIVKEQRVIVSKLNAGA